MKEVLPALGPAPQPPVVLLVAEGPGHLRDAVVVEGVVEGPRHAIDVQGDVSLLAVGVQALVAGQPGEGAQPAALLHHRVPDRLVGAGDVVAADPFW